MDYYKNYVTDILVRTKRYALDYVKALLVMALLTWVVAAIGLRLIGIDHFILKALLIAVVDLLPVLGASFVMIPWIIFRLIDGSVAVAGQLGVMFIVIIIIRQIVEPYIVGKSLGIRPIFSFIIFIIGFVVGGPVGVVVSFFIVILFKAYLEVADIQSANIREKKRRNRQEFHDQNPYRY